MKPSLKVLLAALMISGCSDPVASQDCLTVQLNDRCWTFLGPEGLGITALADTPWGLYAGTRDSGILRLDPGNEAWESLGLDHAMVSAILFVPEASPRLLVGVSPTAYERTPAAVFASEDQGRTWIPSDGGLAERNDSLQWAFALAGDPGNPARVYMGQCYEILRSEDAGRSWQYVFGDEDCGGNGINTIVISPDRRGRVWAAAETAFQAAAVLRSDDWGDTWRAFFPTKNADDAVFALVVDPGNPDRVWGGMGGGVKQSDDGGETWTRVLTTHYPGGVVGLVMLRGTLYAASTEFVGSEPGAETRVAGLYRSRDAGATWDTLTVPQAVQGSGNLIVDLEGRLLIRTFSGVWRIDP